MLSIVGGTYLEYCDEPHWSQLYGSGGRAAAAVQEWGSPVELWTYSSDRQDHHATLVALATSFGFTIHPTMIPNPLSFYYVHPLASPQIWPSLQVLPPSPILQVAGDALLRFGMLEGDAVVTGDWVVYDPQSAFAPQPFGRNGSTAEHLALVANTAEVRALAGELHLLPEGNTLRADEVGELLRQAQQAEVLVMKQGAAGALVLTSGGIEHVPAFETAEVWPLGSGDVFAAIFALAWATEHQDPHAAARRASLATAQYCATRVLPIPHSLDESDFRPGPPLVLGPPPQVYLAGPFFTMAQRWLINEARRALRAQGLQVFSPFHEVGPGAAETVAPADIEALQRSQIVFAVLDGLDAGTLFEVGFAHAHHIPVVALAQQVAPEDVKMVTGTGGRVVSDFATAIYQTAWAVRQP
jgi:nucleoside 2-deoxyribosyltransferase